MNNKHNDTDHWLAQHYTLDKTDQKHNMQRKKHQDSCLIPCVLRSVCSNVCVSITARHPYSAGEFSTSRNAKWDQGGDRCELGRGTGGTALDVVWMDLLWWSSAGDVFIDGSRLWRCQLQRVSTSRSRRVAAHALEVRSAMVEKGMTFNVVCETDASARAIATRRGVGRVRHLDARLLWLQQLCAEGVVHWCLRSSQAWRAQQTWEQRWSISGEWRRFWKEHAFDRQWVGAHEWCRRLSPRLQRQQKIALY